MHKILNYILYFFAGLLILVLLLLLFTQTPVFRGIVRSQVVKIANEQLNGEVTLEDVEGSFFTSLTLNGLWVGKTRQDTILSFDRLALRYSLWPLLNGKVSVSSIDLERPFVNLVQNPDSSWNFQDILPASDEEPDTSSTPMKMTFKLGSLNLSDGHINVSMSDTLVPKFISGLNLEAGGRYSSNQMELDLTHLGFTTPEGITDLSHFQVWVGQQDSVWTVKDLALVTSLNRFDFSGQYAGLDSLSGDLNTEPLQLEEFAWVIPDFRLGVTPKISLHADVEENNLSIDLEVAHQNQKVSLKGWVFNFTDALSDSLRHQSNLDIQLIFQNLNPEEWLLLSDLPLIINGNLQISGNGLAGSRRPFILKGNLSGTKWDQYRFNKLGLNGSFLDGQTDVHTRFSVDFGTFDLRASANLKRANSPVAIDLKVESFPADRFLPEWGDSTLLNMNLQARGTGQNFESLNAGFSFLMHHSIAARVPVDSLLMSGRIKKGTVILDTLQLKNSSIELAAEGSYGDKGIITSVFDVVLHDLTAFKSYVVQPARWKSLNMSGTANGQADSLLMDVLMQSDSLVYDTIATVGSLNFLSAGLLSPDGFSGNGELVLNDIKASGQEADSLRLDADMQKDSWDATLNLWMPDSISLSTQVLGNMKMPFKFQIPKLEIATSFEQFSLVGKGPEVIIDSIRIALDSLQMVARQNPEFGFMAGGEYLPGDSVGMNALVENFDLSLIGKILQQELPVSGMVSLKLLADGPLSNPSLDFKLRVDSLEAFDFKAKQLDVGVSHFSDTLSASMMLKSIKNDSIMANMFSVVNVNLMDSQMVSTLKTINGEVVGRNIRPSAFFVFDDGDEQLFKALLNMNVKISGDLVSPVMKGFVRVTNGGLSWPAYGVKYSDLKLVVNLDSNRVVVDSLFARSEKGNLLVKGNMVFDSTFVFGNLSDAELSLNAKNFFLSRHRNHEIQINSDAWVRIKDEIPEFGGDLTILRSRFYLPALLNMGESSDINQPMLVRALEQQKTDSLVLEERDTVRISRRDSVPANDMLKNLTGRMNIQIPRNTWIKSEDMNLELYGDFDLLKNSTYFEIFGSLGISRGYYTLYGRKLIIQKGDLTFQGGEEINPRVNLEASYQFRGKDKQKNELLMKAAGTAFEPNLSFTLNGTDITERDAMAYLIFNQSFDELSFGNQQGVSGNVPSAMLSGLVSSQLTKTIGNTFNLDLVEVQAGDDWESATFMVGKYITNNLFVTYQRGFGENKEESLTPQTITLEYEVTRNLFLRLTQGDVKDSGVDVILKFEKKK